MARALVRLTRVPVRVDLDDDQAGMALRGRLEDARRNSGLFDMAGYARDFTAALTLMFQRSERGLAPEDFEVPA